MPVAGNSVSLKQVMKSDARKAGYGLPNGAGRRADVEARRGRPRRTRPFGRYFGVVEPEEVIRSVLEGRRTWAVVGCSPDPSRDSHRIAGMLQSRGYTVIPVNPN